jgi:hypothetical protein
MRGSRPADQPTSRPAQAQTIDQPLTRLRSHLEERGDTVDERAVFRDAGYSGVGRP